MFGVLFGVLLGFLIFTLVSHPKSRIRKKLPSKRIKNVQVLPNMTISARNKVFHFHHWMTLTPLFIFIQNIMHSDIVNGFLLGGIFQGLMYRNRFKFIFKQEDHHEQINKSGLHVPLIRRIIKR